VNLDCLTLEQVALDVCGIGVYVVDESVLPISSEYAACTYPSLDLAVKDMLQDMDR